MSDNNYKISWKWLIKMSDDGYKIYWERLIFIIFCIWAGLGILIYIFVDESSHGTFGDMFGAVNSLFSGLAFAGIIVTIFLQKTELSLQHKELKQTRGELEGQKIELQKQNAALAKQIFETTFFQLLVLQHETAKHLEFTTSYKKESCNEKGKLAIKLFYDAVLKNIWDESLHNRQEKMKTQGIEQDPTIEFEISHIKKDVMPLCYKKYQAFSHYFNGFIVLLELILKNEVLDLDKKLYIDLIKAQLTNYEKAILFYYILSNDIDENLKNILKENNFFKDALFLSNDHNNTYL